jgi:hypothetical protein
MIFRKKTPPPPRCHFRQLVAAKESWGAVLRQLAFRPRTTNLLLRKQSIDAATEVAIKSSCMLFAVELFEIIALNDKRLNAVAGEEPLVLECLAFSASLVCNLIDPGSDDYDRCLSARQSVFASMSLMSVLDDDDIEDTLSARSDLYDKAVTSFDRTEYLADTLARILTYLSNGEHFSRIEVRYEDPADPTYRSIARSFISGATVKLKEMSRLIVSREMDEEERFEDDTDPVDEYVESIDRSAASYHSLIDAQIELTHQFMRDRFGDRAEMVSDGPYDLKTLSVFAVHAATLLAVSRDSTGVDRSILNGFRRALSFRTPNTMPDVNLPANTFVSYCSDEESFMHQQAAVFEKQGLEPIVRDLLLSVGGSSHDYDPLSGHIEKAA